MGDDDAPRRYDMASADPAERERGAYAAGIAGRVDEAGLQTLLGLLRDPEGDVRVAAIFALQRVGDERVIPYLERVAQAVDNDNYLYTFGYWEHPSSTVEDARNAIDAIRRRLAQQANL